ncbi:MAG TPA: glycerophosphodiester phosphodiesterase family protein [Bacteroidetes bacterium]|nr:glycerophosphodiester phosphodiesterase family protein [Bacteroidota bacterium]
MNRKCKPVACVIMVFLLAGILSVAGLYAGIFHDDLERPAPFPVAENGLLLFAHRGVDDYFPENSLKGFRAAGRLGFHAVELDVRMTADSEIIIFHDPDGERLLGRDLEISDARAESIRSLPLHFMGEPTDSGPLLLEEFFARMPDSTLVYIDIKPVRDFDKTLVTDELVEIVTDHGAGNQVIMASSDIFLLQRIRSEDPQIRTALEGFNAGKEWVYALIPLAWRPDYLSGFASGVDSAHISWLEENGLTGKRIVYGVDSSNFHSLREQGISCMIIDYGRYLDEVLPVPSACAATILHPDRQTKPENHEQ